MNPPSPLDPLLDGLYKGYPSTQAPRRCSEVGGAGWNVLAGDLPLPVALLKREALEHNLAWMQARVNGWGLSFAPHGKTTLSPQLFKRQLDAGAWGISFATVTQLALGVAAGVRCALVANQVLADEDLAGIQRLLRAQPGLRVVFLLDSLAQLALIDDWALRHPGSVAFEVLLEMGVDGGRTGCRSLAEAMQLADRAHASAAVRLVGIECYEGLGATGDSAADGAYVNALMDRVDAVAREVSLRGFFETDEVLVSAGGSAVYDLVAQRLRPALGRPVRGVLRSGCYLTHDQGSYRRFQRAVDARMACPDGTSLQAALEVWAQVQSRPEPGLALLAVGKRDISFDWELPVPLARAARGTTRTQAVPPGWKIAALNDQHAYLRWPPEEEALAPQVGERVGLGVSHPCTTFDKWRWMPIVEEDYRVSDAVCMHF